MPVEFHRVRAGLSVGSFRGRLCPSVAPRNGRLDPLIEKRRVSRAFQHGPGRIRTCDGIKVPALPAELPARARPV